MRDICISDTLLTNHQEVMSIETGRVSQNELGDMILYSDQNLIVVAELLKNQGRKIQAHSNPGNRQLRLGDEKMTNNLLSVS